MGEVDPAFVQALEHRPKLTVTEVQGIPLIDLSSFSTNNSITGPSAIEGLVTQIGSACKEWGFFQVINHGVPLDHRQRIEAAARKFFALSLEEKNKVRRDAVHVTGYYDTEHTKNVRDWKEVFDFAVEEPTLVIDPYDKEVTHWNNQWPEYPPELREVCQEYAQDMVRLALRLLELIALSLGLPPKRFHGFIKDHSSFIRLNHYPPCPSPHLALGVGRHKDPGVLTILAQDDVGGLQVKRKSDGEWVRVKPTPDAYIINVGDIVQVWSNDAYESVEHRVMVNSEKERFSIPLFLNPSHYTVVEPLEELINEQNPPKYRSYNWGMFHTTRKGSNYRKLSVENIQISHFRI